MTRRTWTAGLLLPILLSLPAGCTGTSPPPNDLDPTAPLVFVRTLRSDDRTLAEFRVRNTTGENVSIRTGVYRLEKWQDGKWVEAPAENPTVAPRMVLLPGGVYDFLVPWDDTDARKRRIGVEIQYEKSKRTETVWSDGVPADTN